MRETTLNLGSLLLYQLEKGNLTRKLLYSKYNSCVLKNSEITIRSSLNLRSLLL